MESVNTVYIIVFIIAVAFLGFAFSGILRRSVSAEKREENDAPQNEQRRGLARMQRRPREAENGAENDASDDSDEDEAAEDTAALADGLTRRKRIGTKKKKKLEMKEAKREYREYEEEQRRKKKEEEMIADRERRKLERAQEAEKMKQEEEERLERELKEEEEYKQWKGLIAVDEEGMERENILDEAAVTLQIVQYIKNERVVHIEEMAPQFSLRPEELADKITQIMEQKDSTGAPLLDGLFDREQGKFLYIPIEERRKIAALIKQHGRISVQDLTWEARRVIDLSPNPSSQS